MDATLSELLGEGFSTIAHIVTGIEQGQDPDLDATSDVEGRIRAHLRVAGTTAFAIVREVEPVAEDVIEAPRGEEAISAIADLMSALRRVQGMTTGNEKVALEIQRMQTAVRSIFGRLVELRQVSFETLVPALRRQARGVASLHEKLVELDIRGETTLVDSPVLAALQGCLAQLITNAVVHGLETPEDRRRAGKPRAGRITLAVERTGDNLKIQFSDDGAGFDEARLRAIASEPTGDAIEIAGRPGVTTARFVDGHAGRGQGLGAIHHAIEQLDGVMLVSSRPGEGSRFHITMPSATRPAELLLVQAGGLTLGLPARVLARRPPTMASGVSPLLDLPVTGSAIIGLRDGGVRGVDRIIGSVDALVSPPPFPINRLPRVTGSTVGPDGTILFVVDPSLANPSPGVPR